MPTQSRFKDPKVGRKVYLTIEELHSVDDLARAKLVSFSDFVRSLILQELDRNGFKSPETKEFESIEQNKSFSLFDDKEQEELLKLSQNKG